jgi:hypothetical protein
VRTANPGWNEETHPDRYNTDVKEHAVVAAHQVPPPPGPRGDQPRRRARCRPEAEPHLVTSRTVKVGVRLDEHAARCVAR